MHSAQAWANDALCRQALQIATELPADVSRRSLSYLALFRAQSRGLIWSKALRLLSELKDEVCQASIQWQNKPARPNTARAWADAMEQVIAHPPKRLPLKSHGYLKAIAYEIADEMDKAAEKRRVLQDQSGAVRHDSGSTQGGFEPVTREDIQNLRRKRGNESA